jgi:hypothetical protein
MSWERPRETDALQVLLADIPVEVEKIDIWDDILDDGKIKYRTLREAYEAFRDEQEEME